MNLADWGVEYYWPTDWSPHGFFHSKTSSIEPVLLMSNILSFSLIFGVKVEIGILCDSCAIFRLRIPPTVSMILRDASTSWSRADQSSTSSQLIQHFPNWLRDSLRSLWDCQPTAGSSPKSISIRRFLGLLSSFFLPSGNVRNLLLPSSKWKLPVEDIKKKIFIIFGWWKSIRGG